MILMMMGDHSLGVEGRKEEWIFAAHVPPHTLLLSFRPLLVPRPWNWPDCRQTMAGRGWDGWMHAWDGGAVIYTHTHIPYKFTLVII
jgi:hypothetical protein